MWSSYATKIGRAHVRSATRSGEGIRKVERVTELARLVTAWTGNDGRVVEYTEDDLAAAASASEPLLREVAKQGLTVAGTRAWFNKQLRSIRETSAARRS